MPSPILGLEHAVPIRLAVQLALLALILGAAQAGRASGAASEPEHGMVAKPRDRPLPRYPESAARTGQEGWARVSYVVTTDGGVEAAVVEDSSGLRSFERAALKAVSRWEFEPATWNGRPVEQCHNRVHVSFALPQPRAGARRSFIREYREISELLERGSEDEASVRVEALAMRKGLNLYESSRVYSLRAVLAGRRGEASIEHAAIRRALMSGDRFLEPEVYRRLLLRRFALEVQTRRYSDALATFDELEEIAGAHGVPDEARAAAATLSGLRESPQRITVAGSITKPRSDGEDLGVWHHTLFHREIAFESIEGALERFELRCAWRRFRDAPAPEASWLVPEAWGDCSIYVFGSPGARFDLVEYGPAPGARAASE